MLQVYWLVVRKQNAFWRKPRNLWKRLGFLGIAPPQPIRSFAATAVRPRVKNVTCSSARALEEAEHHGEVLGPEAGPDEELIERRRLGTHGRDGARGLRRLLRELQVLQHHVRGESRLVIAVRGWRGPRAGRGAVTRHGPALSRRLRADVEELLDVEAELLRELKALAGADHGDREHHVVADLRGLAVAGRPRVNNGLAHPLQDRLGTLETRDRATHHEGERARGGTADAARNRRIHHLEAVLTSRLGDVARGLDVDR